MVYNNIILITQTKWDGPVLSAEWWDVLNKIHNSRTMTTTTHV